MTKKQMECSNCGLLKPLDCYHKGAKQCKECRSAKDKKFREENKEALKIRKKAEYERNKAKHLETKHKYNLANKELLAEKKREYRKQNPDKEKEAVRKWNEKNKDYRKEYNKKYNEVNREKILEQKKEYQQLNKDKLSEKQKIYKDKNREKINERQRNRKANDPTFRIRSNLATRIWDALNGKAKSAKTMELLGCSIDMLKEHLEAGFDDKMTWENYGTYWHVDHIRPCASFDLIDPAQQRECFNWTNLQPLEAIENIRKGAKLDWAPAE